MALHARLPTRCGVRRPNKPCGPWQLMQSLRINLGCGGRGAVGRARLPLSGALETDELIHGDGFAQRNFAGRNLRSDQQAHDIACNSCNGRG